MAAQRRLALAWALALALAAATRGAQGAGHSAKTLVVYDSDRVLATHSVFLSALEARGHELTTQPAASAGPLHEFGVWFYDNLVLFCSSADELSRSLALPELIRFIDSGRHVLVAADTEPSDALRALANECGVDFDADGTAVVDHFHVAEALDSEADHTAVFSANFSASRVLLSRARRPAGPVAFRGVGLSANAANPLVIKVLVGESTAYSHVPGEALNASARVGADVLLVAAVQMHNGGRVVFSGSLDLFSNEFAAATIGGAASGNEAFAAALSEWNFGERGVLRARNLEHRVVGAAVANPEQYRVGDEVEFAIDIEEYEGGAWRPFTESDVQLEYWLLDPVVRRTMRHNGKGRYSLAFKVPESFGVYRYVIDYQKDAYSRLRVEKQVPAHPFRHDEFDRFVLAAYPYYAGAFSMLAGFFIFGIVFLYNKA